MRLIAQYVNHVPTKDWAFEAFGGTWGISEYKIVPGEQLVSTFWLWSEVLELRIAALNALGWVAVGVGVIISSGIILVGRLRRKKAV